VVHDLASVYVADKYDLFHQIYIRKVVPTLLRRLDGVVTISENTRQDVIEHVPLPPKRVHAVRCGVDHGRFAPGLEGPAREEVLSRHGLSGPYVIYVSRIEHPGKNHVRLIEAFDRLKRRHPGLPHSLLLVGGDRERAEEVHQAAERVSTASSIRFSGFIDRADLRALYEGAALAITPSLFEGFGLPVLEAMACGTAVACSRTSALPEVAGGAAALFDPYDVESIASVLERVLLDDALREDLRRRGLERSAAFTWQGCAQRTLEVVKGFAR
jgi:glycosyltransferase involved in cell wall biosynthesis